MRYKTREIKDGTGFEPDAEWEQVQDYNGWTNRETWAVALWINNEQGWQESVHDALREALPEVAEEDNGPDAPMLTVHAAGEIVRANVEELFDWDNYGDEHGGQRCVPALLLVALEDIGSLYRVNWDEIGAAFLTDVAEQS